jgi:prepilin peptidase CpaA
MIALALVLIAAAVAAYSDLKTRRIPNELAAILLVAGLTLSATRGWQSAAVSIGLCLLVFALGTLLFSFKLIGGGDVKLLAAAAAVLGWPDTVAFLLYTILAGGVLGLATAIVRGRLRPMLSNLKAMLFPVLSGLRPAAVPSAAGSMPYAVAIFVGAAALTVGDALGFSLGVLL